MLELFLYSASRMSNNVYAIEPIEIKSLMKNITNNGAKITIFPFALGDGGETTIIWHKTRKFMRTVTFESIKEMCGGCDFLKLDCEGGEWYINPQWLDGVRRIEGELHDYKTKDKYGLINYLKDNYEFQIEWETRKQMVFHAYG